MHRRSPAIHPSHHTAACALALRWHGQVFAASFSGTGSVTGDIVDCGLAERGCPANTTGNICLAQRGGVGPSGALLYNCDRVMACVRAGAAAVLLLPHPADGYNSTDYMREWASRMHVCVLLQCGVRGVLLCVH
jgi:hypothetical protein